MYAPGRRLEDVQALTKTWYECDFGDGTSYVKFTFYDGWAGKAVRLDNWRPHDNTILQLIK